MRIAFWKGTDPGFAGVLDRGIRWWTDGPYSHNEVIFSDGWTGTASWADKGVKLLKRPEEYYDNLDDWVIIDIEGDENVVRGWFFERQGAPYDLLGVFGFVWRPIRGMDGAFFCSEAFAAALGWADAHQYSPNLLYDTLLVSRNVAKKLAAA
jgi:hypothetical protein